ncbi:MULTISPECIES: DUF1269 domain-containing protein [Ruegeria]|uniref:DUF1269 domain-containing protein n=1 Tax=Ruegeria TaxID=97050 RepID=UPI00147F880D|nr:MULTISPECIES: DUF1269 domain-containing protein [Ruegeria]NOD48494.1 DUF1269 domain-containing protein [Ruegeria sp. HKCCD5849]NOD52514.1 DUF1269 domain-containing protein [Ruegeria sp. HKCCD5851]NOD68617.1 DUF1269 domain-containing protein [Ruegeria sp. HKCCD7303]NOE36289.1 DUF1269 domain-containing protein [Ruegeria sp. HKCCD7318]
MSNLVIILFEGRHAADEALLRVAKMSKEWEADINEFIVITRNEAGDIRIKNSDTLTATGMLGGGAMGSLTGVMIGALAGNPAAGLLLGAAAGTGMGTLAGALDQADDEDRLAAMLGSKLKPDTSALAMIGWTSRPTKLLNELEGLKGEVIETSLSVSDEKELRAALSTQA